MKKLILLLIVIILCAAVVYSSVTNFEAKGNLESKRPIECVGFKGLSNKITPPDMFIGISECVDSSDYENASEIFIASLVYGNFDKKRVEDKTAHQAITVLKLNYFGSLDKENSTKFQNAINETIKNKSSVCESLRSLGSPDYYPHYMIQHGMGAFLGNESKDGLVKGFNAKHAWEDVLQNYLKCDQ